MIGPDDVQRWAESLFDDFLRSLLTGADFFSPPKRRERLGRVPAGDDPLAFRDAVQPLWDGSKAARGFGYIVVLEAKQRRSRGGQNEPVAVELGSRDDFLRLLDREKVVEGFEADAHLLLQNLPDVLPALLSRPRLILENHGAWPGIIEVVDYLRRHPRPGCFVRALPVSVPTKFIERHETAIEALLAVLPEAAFRPDGDSFAERCGFAANEGSIRGRFLCPQLQTDLGFPAFAADLELRVSAWASITLPTDCRVIVCENRANFLALPPLPRTLALWGAGGAATGHFPRLPWLQNVEIIYWGDMDPSGYAILAHLRRSFPRLRSVLMDDDVLRLHPELIAEAKPASGQIAWEHLSPTESNAARFLLEPPRGIEQEKLLFRDGLAEIFLGRSPSVAVKLR